MTPSKQEQCEHGIHVLPSAGVAGTLEGQDHLAVCSQCASLQRDFNTLASALDWWAVEKPDPARWSNLSGDVLAEIAIQKSTAACPDFEGHLISEASEDILDPELESHLASCENCQRRFEEFRAIHKLLDLPPVPRPDPVRWNGLKARVLDAVATANKPKNVFALYFPRVFLKVAAAVLLLLTGALAGRSWPTPPPSLQALNKLRRNANVAFEKQDWQTAESLLQQIVQDGSESETGHALVNRSLSDLEALRRFMRLPKAHGPREQSLAQFIYHYPASVITAKAIAEYGHLKSLKKRPMQKAPQRKGIENFDPMPQPDPQLALAFSKIPAVIGPKGFQAILIKAKEPWLRNAAHVQIALLELNNDNIDAACKELRLIEGSSPASRFAQEQLEILERRE
jgi:hypothetical protein